MKGTGKIISTVLVLILVNSYSARAQRTTENISEKFLTWCSDTHREEIYVHTDRESYIAGEDMWFKIYLFDRQKFMPSSLSKLVYFELISYDNRPVLRKRIMIEDGSGPGQIILPDTLSSGTYTLKAYTAWMRNFPGNYFQKEVTIYNALSSEKPVRRINREKQQNLIPLRSSLTGAAMQINNSLDDNLEILIKADKDFLTRNDNLCFLLIQTRGNINYSGNVMLPGEQTLKVISKKLLLPGINHLVLFDSKGIPVIEKFIFTRLREKEGLILKSDDKFGSREKISLEIELMETTGLQYSDLSISVAPLIESSVPDLCDYMFFGSEYGNEILKKIGSRKLNEIEPAEMDSLLTTLKSNWIDWIEIVAGKKPVISFEPEHSDHFLSGKLMPSSATDTISGKYIIMSVPGKDAVFQYAKTDNKGNFVFRLPIDYAGRDLIFQPEDLSRKSTVSIESSFSEEYSLEGEIDTSSFSIPPDLSKWSINYQVSKIYGSSYSRLNGQSLKTKNLARFYGKPDIELVLDDYIKLPVMQEIFFELMPGVFLKNRRSEYEISIVDPVLNSYLKYPPELFIDGVRIDDPAKIVGLDPEFVERIDVVKGKYYVGDYLFYGIINVITKAGDFSSVNLPDYAVRMFYRAADPVSYFSSPVYSAPDQKQSRIPDFRNTLYWNPSVKNVNGKTTLEFWSSDFPSGYEINIQGVTSGGTPVSYKKRIKTE